MRGAWQAPSPPNDGCLETRPLLPDDEDDCRDLINDDYQLESDIETFEHFTGKTIQPEDDAPILGDELETEDIERSF